jgi:hypothetical protein
MRLMRYAVADGCRRVEAEEPKWPRYQDAELQLADIVEAVNGRLGSTVKSAWFDTQKPLVHVDLLYADSSMVAGVLQNGALARELCSVATRFGYRVDRVDTNIGAMATGDQPSMTVVMAKIQPPAEPKQKKAAKVDKKPQTEPKSAKKSIVPPTPPSSGIIGGGVGPGIISGD